MTLARVAQTAPAYSDVDLTLLAAVGSIRRIIACSGMCVCIVRTGGRLSARADAGAIEPRLDVAALPDTSAGAFSVALSAIISALRVLGPIQCKAVAHKPFTKIGAADRTGRNRAAIWVETERHAIDGRLAMKASRSFAASAPQRYCELSSPRHSWLLSGASTPQSLIRVP